MLKPITVDLPYPDMINVKTDVKTARAIGYAFSSAHSELKTILQYVYHYLYFKKLGDDESAKVILGIAFCEMKHMEVLGDLMIKLGADPVFYYPTPLFNENSISGISYSKIKQKMIFDDVSGEMVAINGYKKIISTISDQTVRNVIERIVLDEELHVKLLQDILQN